MVPYILEDTSDFLTWIMEIKDLPEDVLLISFYVVGLYPHIPHEEGIQNLKDFLSQGEVKDISIKNLRDLAKIILNNYSHQFLGRAIGTKFAPTWDHWDLGPFAPLGPNIFMAGMEKKFFDTNKIKPLLWFRYLENMFRYQEFYQYLSLFHSTMKFTMEFC